MQCVHLWSLLILRLLWRTGDTIGVTPVRVQCAVCSSPEHVLSGFKTATPRTLPPLVVNVGIGVINDDMASAILGDFNLNGHVSTVIEFRAAPKMIYASTIANSRSSGTILAPLIRATSNRVADCVIAMAVSSLACSVCATILTGLTTSHQILGNSTHLQRSQQVLG